MGGDAMHSRSIEMSSTERGAGGSASLRRELAEGQTGRLEVITIGDFRRPSRQEWLCGRILALLYEQLK